MIDAGLAGRRILIVGLGKVTGAAVAEAALGLGAEARVHESFPTERNRISAQALAAAGVSTSFGNPGPEMIDELLDWADLVIPCPGVPPSNPLLAAAARRGSRVWSEVELGYRLAAGPVVAVTGTNGKTTTTSLLTKMLRDSGLAAVAAGNIGVPLVRAARDAPAGTIFVCEVSSFQLAFVEDFKPAVSVVLNVADDHYDWHSGAQDYIAAKARVTEAQDERDLLVVRAGDAACLAIASGSSAKIAGFGLDTPARLRASMDLGLGRAPETVGGVVAGEVVIESPAGAQTVMKVADIPMLGSHNLENVLAAALAASTLGVPAESFAASTAGFENLPHRTELVAEVKGVRYLDDSKATNPHATLRALAGLNRVILIAGGRAKGLDLSVLAEVAGRICGVIVMGEAAGQLARIFAGVPLASAADVEHAVTLAAGMAMQGDTVLLSPACSSLDQYSDYAQRGDRFKQAVLAL